MTVCQRRNTRQRQVVLEELRADNSHPTAALLYDRVRQRLPRISLGTIYRNLDILEETGQCVRLCGSSSAEARFDGRTEPHLHHQCRACGKVRDLETMLPVLDDMIGRRVEDHRVDSFSLIFHGVCAGCRS
jgi:Fur family transcriptional regulator, ferric uptake regulator